MPDSCSLNLRCICRSVLGRLQSYFGLCLGAQLNKQSDLLRLFPPSLHDTIIEFWRHVASIDADYIVFMARKSLRLYDLFTESGFPRSDRIILSDHVIDFAPERFAGKRVALVDDTLILGTTLRKTVDALGVLGAAKVSVHVLFADGLYWNPRIVEPDYVGAVLSHDVLLNFCNASVVALQTRAIPYLTDFPLFRRFRVTAGDLDDMTSIPDWRAYAISGSRGSEQAASYYTLLPSDELRERFSDLVAGENSSPIEIVKMRLFVRHARSMSWLRIVPIVTLAAIQEHNVAVLHLLGPLVHAGPSHDGKAVAHVRLIQYYLSLVAGRIFTHGFRQEKHRQAIELDVTDGARHFGPWFRQDLGRLATSASHLAEEFFAGRAQPLWRGFSPPAIPQHEYDASGDVELRPETPAAGPPRGRSDALEAARESLLVELMQVFVNFYYQYELPAREETKRLGADVLTAPAHMTPHRDRLNYGLSWGALAAALFPKRKRLTARRRDLLSLALDHLVDWGIAVPILAQRNGVLFRAYRHGEDVAFSDQEIALIHDAVSGYLEGAKAEAIPKLQFEKLVVCLLRVGAAREFLNVVHGIHGNDGVVRIGYHLHGAVPFFRTANTYLADNKDSWVSTYVVSRGVLTPEPSKGLVLAKRPDAALIKLSAASDARGLGWLLGKLHGDPQLGENALTANDLIILATCAGPKDLTGALIAEARLLLNWIHAKLRPHANVALENGSYGVLVADGRSGFGMIALNSARLKYNAYVTDRFARVLEQGRRGLAELPEGTFIAQSWVGLWAGISKWEDKEQLRAFKPWIINLVQNFLDIAIDIFMVLAAAIYGQHKQEKLRSRDLQRLSRQVEEVVPVFELNTQVSDGHRRSITRLHQALSGELPIDKIDEAIDFSLKRLTLHGQRLQQTIGNAAEVLDNFGATGAEVGLPIILWFDIVDSNGRKGGLEGEVRDAYQRRVKAFRQGFADDLAAIVQRAKAAGALIHPSYGNLDHEDDETYVYCGTADAKQWAFVVLEALVQRARVNDVRFRSILAPTSFCGVEPYRNEGHPEVHGLIFHKAFSALKQKLRSQENEVLKGDDRVLRTSCLWLCEWSADTAGIPATINFKPVHTYEAATNVDDIEMLTATVAGWVA